MAATRPLTNHDPVIDRRAGVGATPLPKVPLSKESAEHTIVRVPSVGALLDLSDVCCNITHGSPVDGTVSSPPGPLRHTLSSSAAAVTPSATPPAGAPSRSSRTGSSVSSVAARTRSGRLHLGKSSGSSSITLCARMISGRGGNAHVGLKRLYGGIDRHIALCVTGTEDDTAGVGRQSADLLLGVSPIGTKDDTENTGTGATRFGGARLTGGTTPRSNAPRGTGGDEAALGACAQAPGAARMSASASGVIAGAGSGATSPVMAAASS